MTDRQAYKSGSRKAQLANIAAEIFAREGYAATSIDYISKQAGLTGPAVYRHFSSKQEILDVICIRAAEHALAIALEIQSEKDLTHEEMLKKLIRLRVEYLLSPMGASYVLMSSQKAHLSKAARDRVTALQGEVREVCESMLAKIRPKANKVERNVAFFAIQNMLIYTLRGYKRRHMISGDELKCLLEQLSWKTLLV